MIFADTNDHVGVCLGHGCPDCQSKACVAVQLSVF